MVTASILITIFYLFLIGGFVFGFDKINTFKLKDLESKTKFSVIIPFRNEAKYLPNLLDSIEALNYPKQLFEIIFVDDDSDDDSIKIIEKFIIERPFDCTQGDIKIIKNKRKTNSPKKDAITAAINEAKYEWIITTDADCKLPKYWLDSFDEYIQNSNAKCIVAPVTYQNTNGFLNQFQLLDLLSLQGATIGGFGIQKPFLCSGANFGYEKSLFKSLNGFEGNTNIASGDDVFFLEKVIKVTPKHLHYLKCEHAIVTTQPQPNWTDLLSQRVRWAAKTSTYNNWFGKLTGIIVLLMNALMITIALLTFISVFNFKICLYILFIKLNIDFFLIYKSASFFNQKDALKRFVFAFLIYPFFSVYVVFLSTFTSYKWKGRTFKK